MRYACLTKKGYKRKKCFKFKGVKAKWAELFCQKCTGM